MIGHFHGGPVADVLSFDDSFAQSLLYYVYAGPTLGAPAPIPIDPDGYRGGYVTAAE